MDYNWGYRYCGDPYVFFVKGTYNTWFKWMKQLSGQWAQVENVYQRRADLIPNLVSTVKGYAAHEKETLEGVIEARSKATSVNIDPGNLVRRRFNNSRRHRMD